MWTAISAIATIISIALTILWRGWLSGVAQKRKLLDEIHSLEAKRDSLEAKYNEAVKSNNWDTADIVDNQLSGVSAEISLKYSILNKDYG